MRSTPNLGEAPWGWSTVPVTRGLIEQSPSISFLGLEPAAEQEYRERFVVEARAAGRLSHPGIVPIFDVGEEAETRAPYLVLEYVEGQSLDKLLSGENERPPLNTALR